MPQATLVILNCLLRRSYKICQSYTYEQPNKYEIKIAKFLVTVYSSKVSLTSSGSFIVLSFYL